LDINEKLIYTNTDYFEEFMKMLSNAYTVCFQNKEYIKAEAIQEVIQTFEQERDDYLEKIRLENESVIEKSLDNKA
jgi:hypothetical protein